MAVSPLFECFEGGNLTEEYALPFIAASIWIFLDYFINNNINTIRLILCGLSFAAVLLLRANMVAIWIVMCIAVLVKCIRDGCIKELVKYLIFFISGALALILPVVI